MTPPRPDRSFIIPQELHARPLDGVLRTLDKIPWSEARRLIESGKVRVAGDLITNPTRKVRAGDKHRAVHARPEAADGPGPGARRGSRSSTPTRPWWWCASRPG